MDKFRCRYVLLADTAIEDKSGKLSIIGIFDRIQTKQFPAVHGSSVLVGNFEVLDPKIESITLNFLLEDSNGNVIGPKDVNMEIASKAGLSSYNFILFLKTLPFEKDGSYKFVVTANSEPLCECPLTIEKINE